MLRLGAHISIAGGIDKAVDRAVGLGCNTMQIFARNPRRYRKSFLSREEIERFRDKLDKSDISPLVIHSPYTLNLATPRKFFHWITRREFISDLLEGEQLGAGYLVTHIGCYKGTTEKKGLRKAVKALKKILHDTEGTDIQILMENTTGSATWLGYAFWHYRFILEKLEFTPRLGICLDTAHAWGAGYEINTEAGLEKLLEDINQNVGIDRLKIVHLNDTLEELGSRHDRHFHIGEGKIGEDGISRIINHKVFKNLPFILETPAKTEEDVIKNLNMVRRLYQNGVHQSN